MVGSKVSCVSRRPIKQLLCIAMFCSILVLNIKSLQAQANDGHGAFRSGKYRNLFAENGHPKDSIQLKVDKAFQQLFHGDSLQRLYFESGKNQNGTLAYLADVLHQDVRSEGMSYGMMIAVQLDKKKEFDALWNWAVSYMYNSKPKHPSYGYFSWSMHFDGKPAEDSAAPDGEEYFVMSLYFASARWGNGTGIYDYKAWADRILTAMRHRETISGKTLQGDRTVRAMVNDQHKMVCFVPNDGANHFTDPSYHLPAFYELWARFGPKEDRMFWAAAADTSRAFFEKATHPQTGLASDYANFDGRPMAIEWNPSSHYFSYDSWRTAMNWSVDWAWWGKDEREQILSDRIQSFFAKEGIDKYGCQYKLTGENTIPTHSVGLMSMNAVAGLAATHPLAKQFVEALWNAPIPSDLDKRYYDGLLYLMGTMHCSGNFKIWKLK